MHLDRSYDEMDWNVCRRIKTRWKCFGETRSTQYLGRRDEFGSDPIRSNLLVQQGEMRKIWFPGSKIRAYIWTHFALTVKKNKQLVLVFTLSICQPGQPCQVYLINWPTCLHERLAIINHFSLTPLSQLTLIFGAVIFLFKLSGIM